MPWSDGLDPQSITYGIASSANPRVRVVAGPGTGKSFAMKRRVARLLELGIAANTILPVTFTRVAAEDLHRELVGMGVPGCEALEGVTLHSLALRILMRNHVLNSTGRVPRPLNEFELKPLVADLAGAHGGARRVQKRIKAYEAAWARLQQDQPGYVQDPEDAAFEQELLAWLIFHRGMLIGEVIPELYRYLHLNPLAQERSEFTHILVDEFQDLNRAEQGVIELLSGTADVCIVGDDDQSIYSFKYAHPAGIREWLQVNAGADDLTLADCRRCPTRVVAMANALIQRNTDRPVPRQLAPMDANGAGDVRIIQYQSLAHEVAGIGNLVAGMVADGTPAGDILILAQRRVIGTPIYEALRAANVPARSYFAEAELDGEDAQERFAYLKLFVEPSDRVALRWLLGRNSQNWLSGGYRRLRSYAEEHSIVPWELLCQLADGALNIPHTAPLVQRFQEIREEVQRLSSLNLENGLPAVIDDLFPDGHDEFRDLRALSLSVLEATPDIQPADFLSDLTTAITKPEIPSEIEDVRVMSLHKSKGLSSAVTIIAGCVEGVLPKRPSHDLTPAEQLADIEEQRRLFYVGISRVKSSPAAGKPGTLILTCSRRMSQADAKGAGIQPAQFSYGEAHLHTSRFIAEMGPAAPPPIPG